MTGWFPAVLLRFFISFLMLGVVIPAEARRVLIQAGDISLPAEYRAPTQPRMPAILMMHGCGGLLTPTGQISSRMVRVGNLLQEMGYGVLYLDSFTPRGIKQVCSPGASSGTNAPSIRARDAEAAVSWLRRQKNVDGSRIGVLGWSHGADAILSLLGRKNRSIKAAVTYYPSCRSFAKLKKYRVSAPTLVLVGEMDKAAPAQECKKLAAKTGQDLFHVVTYPEVGHDFDAPVASPSAQNDVPNHARSKDSAFNEPAVDAAQDANRRTFKWFSRWFDPERAIQGVPPSSKQGR